MTVQNRYVTGKLDQSDAGFGSGPDLRLLPAAVTAWLLTWWATAERARTVLIVSAVLVFAVMALMCALITSGRSAVAAGWHICLDVADALIKGVPFGPVVGSQAKAYGWPDLNLQYAQILDVKPAFT
jgi:hypothetical protein